MGIRGLGEQADIGGANVPIPKDSIVNISSSDQLATKLARGMEFDAAELQSELFYANEAAIDVIEKVFDFDHADAVDSNGDHKWDRKDMQYGLYILWGYAESGKSELATKVIEEINAIAANDEDHVYYVEQGEPGARGGFPRSDVTFGEWLDQFGTETYKKVVYNKHEDGSVTKETEDAEPIKQHIVVIDSLALLPQQHMVADSPATAKGVPSAYLPTLIDLDRWFTRSKRIAFAIVNPHQDWKDVDQAKLHAGAVTGVFDFATYKFYVRRRKHGQFNRADRLVLPFDRDWSKTHAKQRTSNEFTDYVDRLDAATEFMGD